MLAKTNTYVDPTGRLRELVIRPGAHGSLLVLDRDPATLCDGRLVAHIPADEPRENAVLVCRLYMREGGARPCRRLTAEDLCCEPLSSTPETRQGPRSAPEAAPLSGVAARLSGEAMPLSHQGFLYALRHLRPKQGQVPELRWHRCAEGAGRWSVLTLREVLTAIESYEPARTFTADAIAHAERAEGPSVCALRRECERLQRSALVLNRLLRETVLDAVVRRGVSMSEIALRCGRSKRDRRGQLAGDTSWLARRVGLMAESGRRAPNRWVHSDTLGLIARRGLGVSPREVELG